jgi:hypothetical protein
VKGILKEKPHYTCVRNFPPDPRLPMLDYCSTLGFVALALTQTSKMQLAGQYSITQSKTVQRNSGWKCSSCCLQKVPFGLLPGRDIENTPMCTPDTSSSIARLEKQVLGSFLRTRAVAQSLWIEKSLLIIHVCMLQTQNKSVTLVKLPNPVSLLPSVHVHCAWQIDTKSGRSCTLHGHTCRVAAWEGTRRMHSSPIISPSHQATG